MAYTPADLIYRALRRCGQIRPNASAPGQYVNAEFIAECLCEFQDMYDGWNAERTMQYSVPDYIYPITTNGLAGIYGPNIQFLIGPSFVFNATLTNGSKTATFVTGLGFNSTQGLIIGMQISGTGIPSGTTIQAISQPVSLADSPSLTTPTITMSLAATANGLTGITVTPDFVGPRPEAILRMNLWMTSSSPNTPTRINLSPVSAMEWANISALEINAVNVTTVYYYDPQYPCGVINVWPPLNGNALEIFTWGFLNPPLSRDTLMQIPPGYVDAITWTLAQRLWGVCTNSVVANKFPFAYICGQAKLARDRVRAVNAPMPRLSNDFGGSTISGARGVCDWGLLLTGQPY